MQQKHDIFKMKYPFSNGSYKFNSYRICQDENRFKNNLDKFILIICLKIKNKLVK